MNYKILRFDHRIYLKLIFTHSNGTKSMYRRYSQSRWYYQRTSGEWMLATDIGFLEEFYQWHLQNKGEG